MEPSPDYTKKQSNRRKKKVRNKPNTNNTSAAELETSITASVDVSNSQTPNRLNTSQSSFKKSETSAKHRSERSPKPYSAKKKIEKEIRDNMMSMIGQLDFEKVEKQDSGPTFKAGPQSNNKRRPRKFSDHHDQLAYNESSKNKPRQIKKQTS